MTPSLTCILYGHVHGAGVQMRELDEYAKLSVERSFETDVFGHFTLAPRSRQRNKLLQPFVCQNNLSIMNFSLANFISRLGMFESNESISHPRYDSDVTHDIAKCQYFGGSLVLFLRNSGICGYISILKERATQCHHSGKISLSLMQFSVR